MGDLLTKIIPAVNLRYAAAAIFFLIIADEASMKFFHYYVVEAFTESFNRIFGQTVSSPTMALALMALISVGIAHLVDVIQGTTGAKNAQSGNQAISPSSSTGKTPNE